MLEIIRDISLAAIVLFLGAMAAVAQGGAKEFRIKRVLIWWGCLTLLFAMYRIFF